MNIGKKLKALRVKQALTQEELANRSELTKGFISQVERNLNSPSISTFIDILEALGTTPKDFFLDTDNEKIVFRDEDYFENINEELKYKINWIVPNAQKNLMEPTILELEPLGKSKEILPYDGEELGYVLQGKIKLLLGDEVFSLSKGETFYLKANEVHYIENNSKNKAKVLWVSAPPN
ncbi:MAG: XRE family transcriptional regulator, partial [Gallicola sp.]|nr:XRE family transcriptional regulator [Gallicola sp.]